MVYAMVENGVTVNIIAAETKAAAAEFGALPYYEDCAIGLPYKPPHVITAEERTQQDITDLQLSDIEQGQVITDMQLSDVEQGQIITDLELQLLEVQAHV